MRIEHQINSRLSDQTILIDEMLDLTSNGFDSLKSLDNHLHEGAILNVGKLASKALSIPSGEYMVWTTDPGHTMLVPTSSLSQSTEVFESSGNSYELFTHQLRNSWNLLGNTILEADDDDDDDDEYEFVNRVDVGSVDRTPLLRAMEDSGFSVTDLADAVGVQPPAISRLLRMPKDTPGDPGGRNPSIGLASEVCNVLRIDPDAAFPDIFATGRKYRPRKGKANRGSGKVSKLKGTKND